MFCHPNLIIKELVLRLVAVLFITLCLRTHKCFNSMVEERFGDQRAPAGIQMSVNIFGILIGLMVFNLATNLYRFYSRLLSSTVVYDFR